MLSTAWPFIFTLRIDPKAETFCPGMLRISLYADDETEAFNKSEDTALRVYVSDADVQKIYPAQFEAERINGKLNTFMLMRTNPKLTGNIKLVVDSEYRLYLDTFKASSILNSRNYRKYPISSEGNYPHDVMTVFSSLPQSELFKTPDNSLNPHKYYNNYDQQYITDYEYGAETNTDELYPENMKILAPLHLGKNNPDFFCIFRYDGIYNEETYQSTDVNDMNAVQKLLTDSTVVKIFDLRSYTSIGQYIRNYNNSISEFLHGSCYMQFIEQNTDKVTEATAKEGNENSYRQGNNSWRGVDVARGIITNKIESSYFSNRVLTSSEAVQENFDNFIINGYERNNILYPYILNLEFMFNDDDSETEEFTMHRYFGLYLTENDFLKYNCIISDNKTGNSVIKKYDVDDNEVQDASVLNRIFSLNNFSDKIFFMTTNNDAARVTSTDDVNKFINQYVLNNPDVNIVNIQSEPVKWHKDDKNFITLHFTEPIHYGEHLRFIALNIYDEDSKENKNICLELIGTNDERLVSEDNLISPYILTGSTKGCIHVDPEDNTGRKALATEFYRIGFYTQDVSDASQSATLAAQLERIRAAIARFDSFVRVKSYNDTTLGIVSTHQNVWFQHIAAPNVYDDPAIWKLYMQKNRNKYDLCYTRNEKIAKESYILDVKKAMGNLAGDDIFMMNEYETDGVFFTEKEHDRAVSYIEYEQNKVTDTIRYFSSAEDTEMTPISPDTFTYSSGFAPFSLLSIETLGWRYSNLVKFKSIGDFTNPYTVYDDITDLMKNIKHPLVKMKSGVFETIQYMNVSNAYLTDNILLDFQEDALHIHTQKIVETEHSRPFIISPYNVNEVMIDFFTEPLTHNYEIAVFNPESAALAIMGIISVKDIDMSINLDQDEEVESCMTVTIAAGTTLSIDSLDDSRIQKDIVYRIVSGSFNEFSMYKFIIMGDDIYYTTNPDSTKPNEAKMYTGILTAASDVVLYAETGAGNQTFKFTKKIPVQNDTNYLKDRTRPDTSDLNISIVPQINSLWESNGLYLDNNSVLDVDMLLTKKYEPTGFFTEHAYSPLVDNTSNMFSKNSSSSWYTDGLTVANFKDMITSGKDTRLIKKMLIQNSNIDTAAGYYNSYVQSLEFIYYGIKFNIKFNNEYYNQNLRLGEYNNFEVFIINDSTINQKNELYISADEEIILFVNHTFDVTQLNGQYTRIHDVTKTVTSGADYGVFNAPYSIYTNSICGYPKSMLCHKTNSQIVNYPDWLEDAYYIQEDRKSEIQRDNDAIRSHYIYWNTTDEKTSGNIISVNNGVVGLLKHTNNTYLTGCFDDDVVTDENLTASSGRVNDSFIMTMLNVDADMTRESPGSRIDEYMESMSTNFECYVISNGNVESIDISETYSPISISLQVPKRTKYNFGYFTPRFYDILNFETNDYDLGDALDMSMLLGNTQIASVSRLRTYTGNKVFPKSKEIAVTKNYFIMDEKSVFSSSWDNKYYRTYNSDSDSDWKYVNGYISGIEDKSFFGSKCLVIKSDYILLNDFHSTRSNPTVKYGNSQYNRYAENRIQCRISINITQSIYEKFYTDEVFRSNWSGFHEDFDTAIGNYIQNSIFNIYNMQRQKEVVLYSKPGTKNSGMNVVFDDVDITEDGWSVIDGFESVFTVENNEMILTITMNTLEDVIIHPQVKIYKY